MRKLLISAAVAASMTGCTTAQVTSLNTITAGFIGAVQASAAATCSIIPTVQSIEAVVNVVYTGAVPITAVVNQVMQAICAAAPPKTSERFAALPTPAQSPGVPVNIGTSSAGTAVQGWRAGSVRFGHRHR